MSEDKIVRKLRLQLEAALAKQKDDQAIGLLLELIKVEPKSTRWPHKLGDLYRKRNRKEEAIEQYALAADLYQTQGFLARAIAIAKAVYDMDPKRVDVLERIDPDSARKLGTARKPPGASMRPAAHPAVLDDEMTGHAPARPVVHRSIMPEGPSSKGHPAVLVEDELATLGRAAANRKSPVPERTTHSGDNPLNKRTTFSGDNPLAKRTTLSGDNPLAKRTTHSGDSPLNKRTTFSGDNPLAKRTTFSGDNPLAKRTTLSGHGPLQHAAIVEENSDALDADDDALREHGAMSDDASPSAPARPNSPAHEGRTARRHPAVIPEPGFELATAPTPAAVRDEPAQKKRHRITLEDSAVTRMPAPQPEPPPARARRVAAPPPEAIEAVPTRLAGAPELTPAPDAEEHEVRFSDVPPEQAVRVELSAVEVRRRQPTNPSLLPEPSPLSAANLATLPLFPLFAEIPQPAFRDLITSAEVLQLSDGALVYQRDDPADALFGIVEGSVELKFQATGMGLTLAEGDVFGESCLLTGEKRNAEVHVRGQLVALKFARAKLAQLAAAQPQVTELLIELLTRRLMTNLVQTSPLFQEFDAQARAELTSQFEVRRAARGTILADLGKVSDGLYISLTGTLEVTYADGRPVEEHPAGTLFGQSSLLTRSPSDIRVRAAHHMLVLRLPLRGFQTIAMQYPSTLAHLSTLAETSVAQISG